MAGGGQGTGEVRAGNGVTTNHERRGTTMRGAWMRLIAAFAVSGAVLAACAPGISRPVVAKTYRWAYSTGGIAGRRVTPDSQHLSVIYSFVNDSVLFIVKNPGGVDTTHYHITPGGGTAGRDLIHYKHPVGILPPTDTLQYFRRMGRDTIVLSDRCADCYEHTLVRITY
jgi:hypothetical protein